MSKLMFIDGNNIAFAAQTANKLTVGSRQVQAIFGFIKTLRRLMVENPGYKPLVLWDGRAQRRFDLYPDYKGNRGKDPKMVAHKEAMKEQLPDIQQALTHLGIRQLHSKVDEADDLAAVMTRKAINSGNEVLLISGDKDWVQLVGRTCRWYDPVRDRHCTAANFSEFTGLASVDQFVQVKALAGDTSDNIKGVGGIGEGGALDLMLQFESVDNFFKLAEEEKLPKKLPKAFQRLAYGTESFVYRGKEYPPMRETYARNMRLMDLRDVETPKKEDMTVTRGAFDRTSFVEFCEELNFASILGNLSAWTDPFMRNR